MWAEANLDVTQPDKFAASPFQYDCSFVSWGNVDMHNPINEHSFEYNWGGINNQAPYYEGQVYGETPGNDINGDIPPSHDVAFVQMGAPWRIPTDLEFAELLDNCDYVEADGNTVIPVETADKTVTVNNVVGIYLKSKNNGNLLFFACTGWGTNANYENRGAISFYWSSTYGSERYAHGLYFYHGAGAQVGTRFRYYGIPVRPVFNNNRRLALSALSKYAGLKVKDNLEPIVSEKTKQ